MKSFQDAIDWYLEKKISKSDRTVSSTRDAFQGRLDNLHGELTAKDFHDDDIADILVAIGELGNNCFDHNLGQWKDVPGCLFGYELAKGSIRVWIVDRGQGFLKSLRQVVKDLLTDQAAIELAYERVISGRSPEKRGNGLKLVRRIINGNESRALITISGKGRLQLGGLERPKSLAHLKGLKSKHHAGVFTVIEWNFK